MNNVILSHKYLPPVSGAYRLCVHTDASRAPYHEGVSFVVLGSRDSQRFDASDASCALDGCDEPRPGGLAFPTYYLRDIWGKSNLNPPTS